MVILLGKPSDLFATMVQNGELLLQQRSLNKDVQPGKWDTSVAGHIDIGETPVEAALREALEEVGVKGITPLFITKYIIETDQQSELSQCYYGIYDGKYNTNEEE